MTSVLAQAEHSFNILPLLGIRRRFFMLPDRTTNRKMRETIMNKQKHSIIVQMTHKTNLNIKWNPSRYLLVSTVAYLTQEQ